ncbi:MAG: hypothetical protein HYX53_09760 [Chloroflexi bacterium]|nr:hypothetical protein [Chloroflexota bacterium]
MFVRALLATAVAVVLFSACGSGRSYSTNLDDDKYDLGAMGLDAGDVPNGMVEQLAKSFDNAEWAAVVGQDDPEAKQAQLDAQGRLKAYVKLFTREDPSSQLAKALSITSQSTLYADVKTAQESTRTYCGLLVDETGPVETFGVPKLGDESAGFFITTADPQAGTRVDTTVCFRTGRIVNAVVQTGFNGSQDVALSVRLAQRMLVRVNLAFDGKAPPSEEPTPEPSGSPEGGAIPPGSLTPDASATEAPQGG